MGHNCSGVKRTARMKRAKRHEARLAKKYAEAEAGPLELDRRSRRREEGSLGG